MVFAFGGQRRKDARRFPRLPAHLLEICIGHWFGPSKCLCQPAQSDGDGDKLGEPLRTPSRLNTHSVLAFLASWRFRPVPSLRLCGSAVLDEHHEVVAVDDFGSILVA